MGPASDPVTATQGDAVIFVEIDYDYQPLISKMFTTARTVKTSAVFNVRDSRDLSQIYQRDPNHPDPVADCSVYDSY